ncbi:MAG: NADP-dependent oxidoreductase [Nitrospira sp.]|nr:NADP-dependent oxidoreductase [Nitrospira sp.]
MTGTCKQWILRRRPVGLVAEGDLELVESDIPVPGEGEVQIRTIYLSLDPTNRIWMDSRDQYMPPVEIGQPMRGGTLGIVEASRNAGFSRGDIVSPGLGAWESHSVIHGSRLKAVKIAPGLPLSAHMSVLGGAGITAYFGVTEVARPQPGETLVVSAAAGSVGSLACQIAKHQGARVVGIAGGEEKCDWLMSQLRLDGAIDYKSEDVGTALDRLCPTGVDAIFENVGGHIMEEAFSRLNNHGRLAICGLISSYNDTGPVPWPGDFASVLMRRLEIRGLLLSDYYPRAGEALRYLSERLSEQKIVWRVEFIDGIENAVEGLERLFKGKNSGKLLVRVSPDDGLV